MNEVASEDAVRYALSFLVAAIAAGASGELLTILAGALVLGAIRLVDDLRTVSPVLRLIVELGTGLALWIVGAHATLLRLPHPHPAARVAVDGP